MTHWCPVRRPARRQATTERLLRNQQDIGDAIKPFYGRAAGERLSSLLTEHILVAADLLGVAKAGDPAAVERHSRVWYRNGNQIGDFLQPTCSATGSLPSYRSASADRLRGRRPALLRSVVGQRASQLDQASGRVRVLGNEAAQLGSRARLHRAQCRLLPKGAHMTASAASPNGHRLLAVIAPGAGPHLVGPPSTIHWTTRPARSRVSLADELIECLTLVDGDPERFQCAAASWHARWCIDLAPLTLTESQTALTALGAIAGPRGTDAAGVLRKLCLLHRQRGTPEVLERWIAQREGRAAPAG